MPDFNFTVQATDDLGLTANRDFVITVNNTSVDRVVFVGETGLARSPDGLTWRTQGGYDSQGISIVWAGDRWIKITELGGTTQNSPNTPMVLHQSFDAITWTKINYNETAFNTFFVGTDVANGSLTYLNNTLYLLVYKMGTFTATAGGTQSLDLYVSTDKGLTWARRSIIGNAGFSGTNCKNNQSLWRNLISDGTPGTLFLAIAPLNSNGAGVNNTGITYGAVTARANVAGNAEVLFLKSIDDGLTWTPSKSAAVNTANAGTSITGMIYVNNAYHVFVGLGANNANSPSVIYKSTDGVTGWTASNLFAPGTPIYINGVLATVGGLFVSGTGYINQTYYTLDYSSLVQSYTDGNLAIKVPNASSTQNLRYTGTTYVGEVIWSCLVETIGPRVVAYRSDFNNPAVFNPDSFTMNGGSLPIAGSWITHETPVLLGTFNCGRLLGSAVRPF